MYVYILYIYTYNRTEENFKSGTIWSFSSYYCKWDAALSFTREIMIKQNQPSSSFQTKPHLFRQHLVGCRRARLRETCKTPFDNLTWGWQKERYFEDIPTRPCRILWSEDFTTELSGCHFPHVQRDFR